MHKQVNLSWMLFDFLYFGAAIACFVFAFAWRGFGGADPDRSHFLRKFLITEKDTIAAIILGTWILASVALSIPAFIHTRRPGTKLKLLNAFNVTVVMSTIATIAIGTAVWYFTLTERKSYMKVWAAASDDSQIWLQETLKCCGYWNATTAGLWTQNSGFCGTAEVAANATTVQGCVTPITQLADSTLNNIFSTVYGFVVIESGLFLATCSLRVLKREDERFRKIDEKRGTKGGFV